MKRILALFLSAALLLALLGGCTSADPETTVISPDPAGESASVPPADTTQEPSLALPGEGPSEEIPEEPSAEPSQEPSQAPATQAPETQAPAAQTPAPKPTSAPTHHPEETHHPEPTHHPEETHHPEPTPAPTPEPSPTVPGGIIIPGLGGGGTTNPSPEPSQSGGGSLEPTGPSASDVDLEDFLGDVFDNYAFPGLGELDTDWIANLFPGLTAIPAVQRVVYTPNIGFNTAEIALVQVASSSDITKAENIFEARRQAILLQQANYIQVVDTWQNNFRVVHKGNYIMMIVHDQCDAIVSDFNAFF